MSARLALFIWVFLLGFMASDLHSQNFTFLPIKPQLNKKITVSYNPAGGKLEKAEKIEAIAYQFSDRSYLPTAIELNLTKRGSNWSATFIPDTSARAIFISFLADNKSENGEPDGYRILLHDAQGNYLPGALGTLAQAYFIGVQLFGLKRNTKIAMENLQQEFALFPAQKEKLLDLYWQLLLATDENGKDRVTSQADSLASRGNLSLKEKKLLANWYSNYLEQPEKAETFKNEILALEPLGDFVESERFGNFYQEKDLNTKLALLEQFKRDFPKSDRVADMENILINAYVRARQYENAKSLLLKGLSKPNSVLYNTVAWDMVENDVDLTSAEEIARQGVQLAREKLANPTLQKPSYLTTKQWRKSLEVSLAYILDTHAYALYKLNRVEESVPLFAEAVSLTERSNGDINERYARALIAANKYQEAFNFLDSLIQGGKVSLAVEELFKTAYVQIKGSEEGLTEYLTGRKAAGISKIKEKLQQQMLNQAAPNFTLIDLAGDSVSLKGLRGKIVILDFWATWCGPCLASFPGMQQAVERFRADNQVEFLFVNTWERGDDVQKRVSDFIKEKNYPFHVLLDLKNEVVTAYGVEGIPTKFVIDRNGIIRFKSVGYGGSASEMVEELSTMIAMVR